MKYWKYLRYVIRHKWFVLQEGLKLGVPLWQLIVHDWSKFLPDEFLPYAEWFYGYKGASWYAAPDSPKRMRLKAAFDTAWLKHQHRNPHHWQHWILQEDSGKVKILPMPERFKREMLADWRGAGRAINGKDETKGWYEKTKPGRKLHVDTQSWIEANL
jgi:hypothetical protein